MAYYELGKGADARICYVHAWNDPQWCALNGLPSPEQRRSEAAKRGAATRKANRERKG